MILGITGTHPRGFARLVEALDAMAAATTEPVVVQAGQTRGRFERCRTFAFLPDDEFDALLRDARLVVTHGGAGAILSSLKHGKVPIVFPRLAGLGEHGDDHQLELAQRFAQEGLCVLVMDADALAQAVRAGARVPPPRGDAGLVTWLREHVRAEEAGRR